MTRPIFSTKQKGGRSLIAWKESATHHRQKTQRAMLARRAVSFLKSSTAPKFSSVAALAKTVDEGQTKWFGRKAVNYILITITGGVALSALDDLIIFQSCSSKAMEKTSTDPAIIEALGEPVVKGPWYNAQLGVAHKRQTVSCKFPVLGPKGTGVLSVKAVRDGDDSWMSYFISRNWDILIIDALLHIPENDENKQTIRITIPTPACAGPSCSIQASQNPDK